MITKEDRTIAFLENIVRRIYGAILRTEFLACEHYPQLKPFLPQDIHFIHAQDLLDMYPDLSPKEREDAICKKYGAVFVEGIGGKLSDGKKHDGRAPDYDDWSTVAENGKMGLNAGILFWVAVSNSVLWVSVSTRRVCCVSLSWRARRIERSFISISSS